MKTHAEAVWVIYTPPADCMCWMDSLCSHGWTWQEITAPDGTLDTCHHSNSFHEAYESLADALRYLSEQSLGGPVRVLRQHQGWARAYVFDADTELPTECDHEAYGPRPEYVIVHEDLHPRRAPLEAL